MQAQILPFCPLIYRISANPNRFSLSLLEKGQPFLYEKGNENRYIYMKTLRFSTFRYDTIHADVNKRRGTVRAFEINKSIKTLKLSYGFYGTGIGGG